VKTLYDYTDPIDCECVRREVALVFSRFFPDDDPALFQQAFGGVEKLFAGEYPGYRASNTHYHDFEHTCSVVLAEARLIYGALAQGKSISFLSALKGMLSALFHDVGLIQTEDDTAGTGAKYTVGHEERSIQFMHQHLDGALDPDDIEDIADCIRCTTLAMSPKRIAFRCEEMKLMGQILGTADLLAQIADRNYLEKLLLLFEEFKEAKLPGYETAYDLLTKTRGFYQYVARPRLDNDLERADRFMRVYFHDRFGVDQDFYDEAIHANLDYLDSVVEECGDNLDCFLFRLRRGSYDQDAIG